MNRRRRHFFVTNRLLAAGLHRERSQVLVMTAVFAAIGLLFTDLAWPPLLALALVPLIWSLPPLLRSRVWAWALQADGLVEVCGRGERVHPWETVQDVAATPDAVIVRTTTGELRFEGRADDREALLAELRTWLDRRDAAPWTMPATQLANWLGIGLDDALRVDRSPLQRWSEVGLQAAAAACCAWIWSRYGNLPAVVPCALAVWWVGIAARESRAKAVTVTPYGLSSGGTQLDWHELVRLAPGSRWPPVWHVVGEGGTITLCGPQAKRIAEVVVRVLEARDPGAVLPRMADVPEHALSRAETAELVAERGLSRTSGEGR